jgi:SAM-dependent methyltransferase
MSIIGNLHNTFVFSRRVEILSDALASLMPSNARVLDVGCGDGTISSLIKSKRPDLDIRGVEVLRREHTHIPVELFDGTHLPYQDETFDVVMFSDVLHHTDDPEIILKEANRVAKRYVVIKDHNRNGWAAGLRLRFMDWIGNARFGVALPYNYWRNSEWKASWDRIGLRPENMITKLGLYPGPVDWLFGGQLHFIALLKKGERFS